MNYSSSKMTTRGMYIPFIIALMMILPVILVFLVDYLTVFSIKENIDKEFKRAVSTCLIKQVKDEYSIDRIATLEDYDPIKEDIAEYLNTHVSEKYKKLKMNITSIDINENDKIYVTYKGIIKYDPMSYVGNDTISIPIMGRSKAQRFDRE